MRAMITAYREDNEDVEFKFVHIFTHIETCEKWADVRTALAKANSPFHSNVTAMLAAVGRSIGNKKTKAMRDAAPAIEQRATILAESRAPPAPQPSSASTTPPATTPPPAPEALSSTDTPPTPTMVADSPIEDIA